MRKHTSLIVASTIFASLSLALSILFIAGNDLLAQMSKKQSQFRQKQERNPKMKIQSSAFSEGGAIPKKYTCSGEDISPPLRWEGVPDGTKSFVLICDDPDAPVGTFVHWVIFNIPANARELKERVPSQPILSDKSKQGINDFRSIGYRGPCPPSGIHRYYFKLYALNQELALVPGATKAQVLKAMEDTVLASVQTMGKFAR
jgi:hypothetical protein